MLAWLLERGWQRLGSIGPLWWWIAGSAGLFGFGALSLAWSSNVEAARFGIEKQLGLLLLPIVVSTVVRDAADYRLLVRSFLLGVAGSLAFCWLVALGSFAFMGYLPTYHDFAVPIASHAGYFALFVLMGMVLVLSPGSVAPVVPRKWWPWAIVFGLASLLALASRLFLGLGVLYLLVWLLLQLRSNVRGASMVVAAGVLVVIVTMLAFSNPVQQRFADLTQGSTEVLTQQEFTYASELNGFNLRLLYWRLAGEVLNEEGAWLSGVGLGDAQAALDARYKALGIFTGDPSRGDSGYLGYNFHNQLLQTLVQLGVPGLLLLLLAIAGLARAAVKLHFTTGLVLVACLCLFLLVESAFERQRGIVVFVLLGGLIQAYREAARA